jgi:CYTH domain-containing protein
MGMEIEPEYPVKEDSWKNRVISRTALAQGYIANRDGFSLWLLRVAGDEARLTIKGAVRGVELRYYSARPVSHPYTLW